MNEEMAAYKKNLEGKCINGAIYPLNKELFSSANVYEKFLKSLDGLLIARPANSCDFLKHPQVFSAVSVLPQLEYEKKESEKANDEDILKKIENEYSRKFYISKILELKEQFPKIEKESIEKKRALGVEDFYFKGLVACIELKCPSNLYNMIYDKIPKDSSHMVYGKNIKELFLDEGKLVTYFQLSNKFQDNVDLTYNKSKAIKEALIQVPSKELKNELSYLHRENYFAVLSPADWEKMILSDEDYKKSSIALNELSRSNFISKNVIGFARPTSTLVHYAAYWGSTTKEIQDTVKLMDDRYETSQIVYSKPDWNGVVVSPKMDDILQTEIDYEVDYFNVYGSVNNENGNWFLIKDKANKEFWIHQSQFYNSVSISNLLLSSYLENLVQFYESPEGSLAKKASANLIIRGFKSKAFQWIGDQLWILIETDKEEFCGDSEEDRTSNVPVSNLWIKAFKDNGEYNFMHASRGC